MISTDFEEKIEQLRRSWANMNSINAEINSELEKCVRRGDFIFDSYFDLKGVIDFVDFPVMLWISENFFKSFPYDKIDRGIKDIFYDNLLCCEVYFFTKWPAMIDLVNSCPDQLCREIYSGCRNSASMVWSGDFNWNEFEGFSDNNAQWLKKHAEESLVRLKPSVMNPWDRHPTG